MVEGANRNGASKRRVPFHPVLCAVKSHFQQSAVRPGPAEKRPYLQEGWAALRDAPYSPLRNKRGTNQWRLENSSRACSNLSP
jgi:hypothetical protein